jgi:acyl carrier protein
MDKSELSVRICDMIAKQLRKPAETVTEEKSMKEDLGADSLDIVEMMMSLEEIYSVTIPDEMLPNLKTIGNIVDYIYDNMKK